MISIHALLAESDDDLEPSSTRKLTFLSTLSLRRATGRFRTIHNTQIDISIHALLAESDAPNRHPCPRSRNFYPRSPCGERLREPTALRTPHHFYPRSPCGERLNRNIANGKRKNFYPRSPCGERLAPPYNLMIQHKISIHALLAESDSPVSAPYATPTISIHALLAESDGCEQYCIRAQAISIHALLAESDRRESRQQPAGEISIHALLAESD